MGHIAHMKTIAITDQITFMESYTKQMDNVVENIWLNFFLHILIERLLLFK